MKLLRSIALTFASTFILAGCIAGKPKKIQSTPSEPTTTFQAEFMNLCKPADLAWDKPLPSPEIPDPPKEAGLSAPEKLTNSKPLNIEGDVQLANFPGIRGKGTTESPYVIENLNFKVKTQNGVTITKTSKPLIIRNCRFTGIPDSKYIPANFAAIRIGDSKNVSVANCKATRCNGIYVGGSQNVSVSKCQLFSTLYGIFSSGGGKIKANYNWVEDSIKYGVFLYNGPDNEIGHNYVAWTGREGIGTNGNRCQNHYYHDNTIIHTGWTAINVEENFVKPGKLGTAKTRVENNLVMDTYYGIILMGDGVICNGNKIYYSGQDGIIIVNNPNAKNHKVKNNLIIGSAQNGIWISQKSSGHLISGNRIIQSHTAIKLSGENCKIIENRISRFMYGIESGVKKMEIVGNEIFQGRNGMAISNTEKSKINKNNFHHLLVVAWIKDSKNMEITENNCDYSGRMLQVRKSNNIFVGKNRFIHLPYGGIDLKNSKDCVISGNIFTDALVRCIGLEESASNKIEKNKIQNVYCQFNGAAVIIKNAANNTVKNNTIEDSKVGFRLEGKKCVGNAIEKNTLDNVSEPLLAEPKKDKDEMLKKNSISL